jgi:hypothetical protein
MSKNNHIVIFSHGFGVGKDDRGLFTDIADSLKNVESVMFDYNDIDEAKNISNYVWRCTRRCLTRF